jgi:hypothetical protein
VTCLSSATVLSSKVETVQAGDAAHGVVDAVTLETAVAENLPVFHPGKDVLHSCTDLLV